MRNRKFCHLLAISLLVQWPVCSMLCRAQAPPPEGTEAKQQSSWESSHSRPALSRLVLALRDFDDANGHLPHRAIRSEEGTPLLSWRVAILPFIGQADLYKEFRLDESWDSDHNHALISSMPAVFKTEIHGDVLPNGPVGKTQTLLPVMDGSLWHGDDAMPPRITQVKDGTAYTMGLLIAPPAQAVTWTRPVDFQIKNPHEIFGDRDHCPIATLDGGFFQISKLATAEEISNLLTNDAGDVVQWNKLLQAK
jgi:hypothetical protein